MAGLGRKVFVANDVLAAADVNGFLMDQSVMVFDDAAARSSAIPAPTEGMVTYLKSTKALEKFTGASFIDVGVDNFTTEGEPGYLLISDGVNGVEWVDNGNAGQLIISAGAAGVEPLPNGDKNQVLTSAGSAGVAFQNTINPFLLIGA